MTDKHREKLYYFLPHTAHICTNWFTRNKLAFLYRSVKKRNLLTLASVFCVTKYM